MKLITGYAIAFCTKAKGMCSVKGKSIISADIFGPLCCVHDAGSF